jgi:hypothetical protein
VVRTIALVVAFGCGAALAYVIFRGWRRPLDHVIVVFGTLVLFVAIEIPDGSPLIGVGLGVSSSILMNLVLRTRIPYPGMGERQPRAPLPTIALALSEPLLAVAAATFWTIESISWALLFTVLALASVALNIAWVLRHDSSYWPPTDSASR